MHRPPFKTIEDAWRLEYSIVLRFVLPDLQSFTAAFWKSQQNRRKGSWRTQA